MIGFLARLAAVLLIFTGFSVSAGVRGAAAQKEFLTASGCSVSNVGYLSELAKEYERVTGTKIFVRGGGSVVGIEDVRNGRVDFAAACRSKDETDPRDVEFIRVAWDVLVFVVNRSNPLDSITLDHVRSIYNGLITNWKQLGGPDKTIKVFLSKPKKGLSGVEASTKQLVLKGREPESLPNLVRLASTGIAEQMVEDTPEGFATTGYSSARKRKLKMLKLGGVLPTARNIVSGKYPLKRPLFILLPANAKPAARKFVEFTLSPQGQHFIRSLGVVSLQEVK